MIDSTLKAEEKLRYPIGKYIIPKKIDRNTLDKWIDQLAEFPNKLKDCLKNLQAEQLENTYREGSWTVRQLIHHILDSHTNCYIRFKWTLTEDNPTIKAYNEQNWANLADYKEDIDLSLAMLELLHKKLVILIKSLSEKEMARTFVHPETGRTWTLKETTGLYAWHGNHHAEHIKIALNNIG